MASKNFIVKNGLEYGNSTSNVVITSNSTQISMKFGNTTANSILLGHTFQFNGSNTATYIADGSLGVFGNTTSPLTPNVTLRVQNVSFSNSTLTSYYGRDQWAIGSGVGGNTTALRTGTNIMRDGQQAVGSNVILSNTGLFVGNSTVNSNSGDSNIVFANSTVNSYYGVNSFKIGEIAAAQSHSFVLTQNSLGMTLVMGNTASNNIIRPSDILLRSGNTIGSISSDTIYLSGNDTSLVVPNTVITSSSWTLGSNLTVNTSTVLIGNATVYNLMDVTKVSIQDPSANKLNMTGNSIQFTGVGSFSVGSSTINSTAVKVGNNTVNSTTFFVGNSTANVVITSSGVLSAPSTSPATANEVGFSLLGAGVGHFSTDSGTVTMQVNRQGGGQLVHYRENGTLGGAISIASGIVTYGTFNGSHWSQLKSNKRIKIERGTVVEAINEMCKWDGEKNEQLPKFKISDTKKSINVYGVFFAWDNDDNLNDALISSLGTYVIRIGANTTVNHGDLLQSAGDGTAEPQEDDIIRSSTIGKVTSNTVIQTYKDGSYLVPCVLYCG